MTKLSGTIMRALLASTVVGSTMGCSTPDPTGNTENVEVARSALSSDGLSETQYMTKCSQMGVPLPPSWGVPTIGPNKAWADTGRLTDSFHGPGFEGEVYVNTTAAGTCVILAHDNKYFDIICQGTTGYACFWEGQQLKSPIPNPDKTLVPNGSWAGGIKAIVSPGGGVGGICSDCHAGQNAFITHFASGSPLNLTGRTGWMPSGWMNPIVPSTWFQNPDPGASAYNSLPKSSCLGCHGSGGPGGRFPTLVPNRFGGNFCATLAVVTNRPASGGGMPPTFNGAINNCTPDSTCAAQTDPFVKSMLKTCGLTASPVARTAASSPVALETRSVSGPGFLGDWDHVVTDNWSGMTHQNQVWSTHYNEDQGRFTGWAFQLDLTGALPTPFQSSAWTKGNSLDGNYLAVMATRYDGSIAERGVLTGGIRNNINTTLAAGAPSAFLRHDRQSAAVYLGQDTQIHQLLWNGSTWSDSLLPMPAGTQPNGDPIGYARAYDPGGSSSVVWACLSGGTTKICEARLQTGVSTVTRIISPKAQIKDNGIGDMFLPRPNTTIWGQTSIAYTAADGVHVILDPTGPGFGPTTESASAVVADTTVVSAPAPYTDQNGNLSVIYRAQSGSTSTIVELRGTSSGSFTKTTVATATSEAFTDDPSVFVSQLPWENTIIYRSMNHVFESQWSYATGGYVQSTVF